MPHIMLEFDFSPIAYLKSCIGSKNLPFFSDQLPQANIITFSPYSRAWFEISVNMDISVLGSYGYIGNIGGYFDKNIDEAKIIQNSWKYLEKIQKNYKISKNTYVKVIL